MSSKTELVYQPISKLYEQLVVGAISSHDLLDCVITRTEESEGKVHAYISRVSEELLRREADRADKQLKEGTAGVLSGIPIAIKDNIYVAGMTCTAGSKILADYVPASDAPCVAALKAEGAIIVGKTNLHEFARGATTNNPHYGATHNPWNLDCIPGGSSGGSAAAVASGFACAALGTDTGGSIRVPASLCGVVGLKPTYERISRAGTVTLSWSMDHVGPITNTVEDAELLTKIMSVDKHLWESDSATIPLEKLRMGVPRKLLVTLAEEHSRKFESNLKHLEGLGVELFDISIPYADSAYTCGITIIYAEAASFHEQWAKKRLEEYGQDLKPLLGEGFAISAVQYLKAQRFRSLFVKEVAKMLTVDVDVLVLPTVAISPPRIGETTVNLKGKNYPVGRVLSLYTSLFNIAGIPAISIPAGSVKGMPVGIELVAARGREGILFAVGKALEKLIEFQRPSLSLSA